METRRSGFSLQVTERCNLECRYCYVLQRKERGPDCSPELCGRFVDFALRESDERLKITFFGGEPLLRPDLIRHTIEYGGAAAVEQGKELSFHVVTNGTLIDDAIGDFIAARRIGLEVSIDGPPSVHNRNRPYSDGSGSFTAVYSNLCRFVDRHPNHPVSIFSVMTGPESLPWLHALCRAIDAESFTANPCREPIDRQDSKGGAVDSGYRFWAKRLESFKDDVLKGETDLDREVSRHAASFLGAGPPPRCGAGVDATIVTWSGQIFPCPMFVGHANMVIGDIEAGFYEKKVEAFLKRIGASRCRKCRAKLICGSGCAYDAYEQSGRIDMPARAVCRTTRDYATRIEKTMVELASRAPEKLLAQTDLLPEKTICEPQDGCRSVSPHSYIVRLTDRCNLACDYCYEKYEKGRVRGNGSMEISTARSVAGYILRGPVRNPTVCLFGGEPLLNRETGRFLMEEITAKGAALGKKPFFHITTNGTIITPEISRTIARFDVTVQVSIDGTMEKHDRHRKSSDGAGTFERIARGIELLLAENPAARIDAQVVLTPGNTDMVQIARDLTKMHFRRISFLVSTWANGSSIGWSMEDIAGLARCEEAFFPFFLESVYRGNPGIHMGFAAMVAAEPEGLRGLCECGGGEVFIDTAGRVYLCPQLFALGAPPIGGCDSSHNLQPAASCIGIGEECRECWAFERCRGGCLVHCQRCPWTVSPLGPEEKKAWCDIMRGRFARAIIARRLIEARFPAGLRKLEAMFES